MLENSCNLVSGFSLLAAAFAIWSIPFANKQRTLEHYKRLKHNETGNLRGFEVKLQPVSRAKKVKKPQKPNDCWNYYRFLNDFHCIEAEIGMDLPYRKQDYWRIRTACMR